MLQHPHLVHPRQHKHYATQQQQQQQPHHQQFQQQQSNSSAQLPPQSMHYHHHLHPSQRSIQQQQQQSGSSDIQHRHKRPIVGQYLAQQTSFSSSEEDLRSTSDFDGKLIFC